MLVQIPQVLTPKEVADLRAVIDVAQWVDGNVTSGHQSAGAKVNLQLPEDCAAARASGVLIATALEANPMFVAAALPAQIFPPLFNRYGVGMGFADHIDNAVRTHRASGLRIRTDLSATLFLTDPADYDGGELVIEDTFGVHEVKLNCGDLILYPSSSLHRVTPVTRGERVSSFFWIQSLIRDDAQRTLLFDLDLSIRALSQALGSQAREAVSLTGTYHNLLRMWAEP